MKRFKLISTLIATVMMLGGLMASALPAAATTATPQVQVSVFKLSSQQVHQVRAAARAHGWSEARIDRVLQDPAMLTVPVKVVATMSPGITNSASGSNSVWGQETYSNVVGMRLASVKMTQPWSWGGGVVTSPVPAPIISASVTSLAAAGGWSYQGVVASSTYFYDSSAIPGSNTHSGHRTYRQFKFTTCFIKFGCYQEKLPTIDIHVNSDGGWNVVSHG